MTHAKKELVDKFASLITAAFGLVAALAWNDAIKLFMTNLGLDKYGPLFYAIIVTLLAVLFTLWIGKAAAKLT
ncbi:hypothetical protein KY337_04650 [Candidatus Woesearchaeota archaeon]|nr:hypothetical protein [Candidatus Woesearchaeota archaeon]